MIIDLANVPWDDIDPHGVLITRLSGERLDQFVYALRDKLGDTVKVVPMAQATEILCLPESALNQMGWYRKGKL